MKLPSIVGFSIPFDTLYCQILSDKVLHRLSYWSLNLTDNRSHLPTLL